MLRPINEIIRNTVGNIIHRLSIVTGEVAVDNGDGSYGVFIAGDPKIYPKIFTLARDPDIAVGDKVRILYKNGCKELPIILPPTIAVAVGNIIFVMYQDYTENNFIKTYNSNGIFITSWSMPAGYYETNCICVDSSNNIYINYGTSIVKRNSNGDILYTKTGISNSEAIAIGADGYIYSRESFGDDVLVKRNTSDLDSVNYIALYNKNWYGLAFDSDGNFYMCNATDGQMEKWQYTDYGRITTHNIVTQSADNSGLCIAGNLIGMGAGFNDKTYELGALTMNKALTQDEQGIGDIDCGYVYETPSSIDNNFLFVGDDWDNANLVLIKYNSSKVLIFRINVTESGSNRVDNAAVAAYPF